MNDTKTRRYVVQSRTPDFGWRAVQKHQTEADALGHLRGISAEGVHRVIRKTPSGGFHVVAEQVNR